MYPFSLRTILTIFAAVMAFACTAVFAIVIEEIATNQLEHQIGDRLAQRTSELADKVDRSISDRYQEIRLMAGVIRGANLTNDPVVLRTQLDSLKRHLPGYAWIGFANEQGKVLVATANLLEGVDVSARPWFGAASRSKFVGDLHPALLLEKELNDGGNEPLRFLDLAVPVGREDGGLAGVLGAHVDWRWVREVVTSLPPSAGSELLLLSSNRTVLLGPPDLQDKTLSIKSVQAAGEGRTGYTVERWPDGKTYLTGFSRERGHHDYPGLDWIVLERQEVESASAPVRTLQKQLAIWGFLIAVFFGLMGWWVAVRIAKPLGLITRAAESLRGGHSTASIPIPTNYREISILATALSGLLTELKQREAELERQATHNSLTALPNRALIKGLLGEIIARSMTDSGEVAVLTVDLDQFKQVNEARGREAGDLVLRMAADRLQRCIARRGVLGQLGKDRFVILLERGASLQAAATAAKQAKEALQQAFVVDDTEFFMRACVGISLFPRDGLEAEELLANSEVALHRAKVKGSYSIKPYEVSMNAAVLESVRLERELRVAMAERQFELHYQPQVSLATGVIAGVEALIRWRHPLRGAISPAQFIPIAEASGLILHIGEWVLDEASRQLAVWHADGFDELRISVNVSSSQFLDDKFLAKVRDSLAGHRLPPGRLQLEITESILMKDVDSNIATINALAEMGVMIAIDDFGTGYSSLSYLKRFRINELKIDRSFVRDLPASEGDRAIINSIIHLSKSMKLRVIAEGVESIEQVGLLKLAGCDEMQGFYFSRPLNAFDCGVLLKSHTRAAAAELVGSIQS